MSDDENPGDKTQRYESGAATDDKSELRNVLAEILLRLDRLESSNRVDPSESSSSKRATIPRGRRETDFDFNLPYQANPTSSNKDKTLHGHSPQAAANGSEADELQEQFNSIKSSLDKVILPPSYKLHDSRSGVKREDQPALNIVSKCGRYVETCLKFLGTVDTDKPVDLEPLTTVLLANIKYLQDEYAALLVKGKFDNNTAQLFRSLQKNNSGFTAESIQNVKIAAELSSFAQKPSHPQQSRNFGNRGSYFDTGSRGGYYRGGYRGHGGYRGRGYDNFNALRGERFRTPPNENRNNDD